MSTDYRFAQRLSDVAYRLRTTVTSIEGVVRVRTLLILKSLPLRTLPKVTAAEFKKIKDDKRHSFFKQLTIYSVKERDNCKWKTLDARHVLTHLTPCYSVTVPG